MDSVFYYNNRELRINLNRPIDISLVLKGTSNTPRAWYLGKPKIEPVKAGDWIGKVTKGARVNFNRIEFSPHAHGTHTESYGHISKEFYSVSEALKIYFFKAKVITLKPETHGKDKCLTLAMLRGLLDKGEAEALIIRTEPNSEDKRHKNYDHTNWPYLEAAAADYIRECKVDHLLIDLPSIDKEEGDVVAHRAFWNYPDNPRRQATITEFVFVPNDCPDGEYMLNLQVANFQNDAAPSRPVLYAIEKS